jgi:hypothetical protein
MDFFYVDSFSNKSEIEMFHFMIQQLTDVKSRNFGASS